MYKNPLWTYFTFLHFISTFSSITNLAQQQSAIAQLTKEGITHFCSGVIRNSSKHPRNACDLAYDEPGYPYCFNTVPTSMFLAFFLQGFFKLKGQPLAQGSVWYLSQIFPIMLYLLWFMIRTMHLEVLLLNIRTPIGNRWQESTLCS